MADERSIMKIPRWVKALCILAAINQYKFLPPFVWGDWTGIVERFILIGLAWVFAYGAVSEPESPVKKGVKL